MRTSPVVASVRVRRQTTSPARSLSPGRPPPRPRLEIRGTSAPRRTHDGALASSRPSSASRVHRRPELSRCCASLGPRRRRGPLLSSASRPLAAQAVVRVARRAHRVRRAPGIRPLRCLGAMGAALAAGRIPPALPRPDRRGKPALAPRPDPHLRGARSPAARHHDRRRDGPPVLDDARALPRSDLEWRRAGAGLRHRRIHREAVSRPAGQHVHGPRATALEREHRQARGEDAQSLHRRYRPAPRSARHSGRPSSRGASKDRGLVRGIRPAGGDAGAPRPDRACFFGPPTKGRADCSWCGRGSAGGFEVKQDRELRHEPCTSHYGISDSSRSTGSCRRDISPLAKDPGLASQRSRRSWVSAGDDCGASRGRGSQQSSAPGVAFQASHARARTITASPCNAHRSGRLPSLAVAAR